MAIQLWKHSFWTFFVKLCVCVCVFSVCLFRRLWRFPRTWNTREYAKCTGAQDTKEIRTYFELSRSDYFNRFRKYDHIKRNIHTIKCVFWVIARKTGGHVSASKACGRNERNENVKIVILFNKNRSSNRVEMRNLMTDFVASYGTASVHIVWILWTWETYEPMQCTYSTIGA